MINICFIVSSQKKVKWVTIKLPDLLTDDIDKFLATDDAKRNGLFSRADYVIRLVSTDLYQNKGVKDVGLSGKPKYS